MAEISEQVIKRINIELSVGEFEVIRKLLGGEDLDRDEIKIEADLSLTFNGFGPSS